MTARVETYSCEERAVSHLILATAAVLLTAATSVASTSAALLRRSCRAMKLTTRSTRTYAFDMRRTSATTSTTTQLLQRAYLTASPSPSPPRVHIVFLYFLSPYPRDTLDALHFMSLYSKKLLFFHAAHLCMESSPRPFRWCLYCIVSTNAALASCVPCVFAFLSSSSSSSLSAFFDRRRW